MSDLILQTKGLRASYITHLYGIDREVKVVDGVDLAIRKNEFFGIAGESGCGKTTLLKLIAGFCKPPLQVQAGSVEFLGLSEPMSLFESTEDELYKIRWRNISYIMQGSMNVLNPVRKVFKSFEDFAYPHMQDLTPAQFKQRVIEHLGNLRLGKEVLDSYPHELSGGMRQRVTIGLATLCSPQIIIADEPTTALDVVVQRETLGLIKRIQKELANTIILVTHDLAVHANVCDRIAIMYAGTIVEEGKTTDIFDRSTHPYTQHLIRSLPRLGDKEKKGYLKGAPPNLADPPPGCRFHPRCPLAVDRCRVEVPRLEPKKSGTMAACFLAE
ncbi:MAG: ABC transporter ATP-binding protein [Spirochaetales bacterium]